MEKSVSENQKSTKKMFGLKHADPFAYRIARVFSVSQKRIPSGQSAWTIDKSMVH